MKLLSVNVGLPREVDWHQYSVQTSIFKEPVSGRIPLRTLNLDGDRQSDLTVHGGKDKAVYCYPFEHYEYWQSELGNDELPMGSFGENFTVEGLLEDSLQIGDRFKIGSAEIMVTQPRMPCFKLGIKFGSDIMVKQFLASRRPGFYVAVTREGEVAAGDEITPVAINSESISISEASRLLLAKNLSEDDLARVHHALTLLALSESWKNMLRERLGVQTNRESL